MNRQFWAVLIVFLASCLFALLFWNLFLSGEDPTYLRQPIGTLVD